MIVKRIGPFSLAKLLGALYGAIGLIFGFVFALASMLGAGIGALSNAEDVPPAWLASLFGIGAVFFLPLFYGGMGFVSGVIGAGLYNLFERMIGGVVVELE